MIQAIIEIAAMLLGALAIGIFFTNRYWKSKFDAVRESNESLQKEVNDLKSEANNLSQKIDGLASDHKKEINDLKDNFKAESVEHKKIYESESKEQKADLKTSAKSLKDEKANVKASAKKIKELEQIIELKEEQLGEKERELEEVSGHLKTHNISYYKQIDGKRYKAATLAEADEAIAGVGDGRISMADAEKIFALIADGHNYTQVEKDTMFYIRTHYKWTPEADELFRKKVRSWAAKGHHLD